MKRIGCLLAVLCIFLGNISLAFADSPDVIVIETVTLGAEYRDIPAVEEAVNRIVFPLLDAKIKLLNVDIRQHETRINQMIANGEQIDLVMAGLTMPMTRMALEGKLLPLDDLVAAHGKYLLSFFGEQMNAGRINGALYAIPADAYTAKSGGFIYNQEMADSLGIRVPNPVTCDQLEQIFSVLHEKLPGVYGTTFGNGETFNAQYDICLEECGSALYAYGVTFDPFKSTKVENLFESPAFRDYVLRHRDWVIKGYAPGQSLTSGIRSNEYVAHKQVFGMTTNYSPIEGPVQQGNYPFPIDIVQITPAVNSTSSMQERMWAVPVTSKSPEKAIAFLDLLFSNAQVANLLSNGIEGIHYRQVEPGVITGVE
ncbi:MAG: extracellular solute-binding protein, partial [Clostridia bacterium]|nr:extracellular solute-binding protein [Clostridia bacterium]